MRRWLALGLLLVLVASGVALARGEVPCDVVALQPSCDVALRPGPAEDVLDLIQVGGVPVRPSTGQLRLTTVAVDEDLDLGEWLRLRTSDVVEVAPRESVFPPGADRDEVTQQNAALMADSQLTATIVALEALGYELDGQGALVAAVASDAVTDALAEGDLITAVDGRPVAENADVVDEVRSRAPGERVVLEVAGGDGTRNVEVELGRAPDDPETAYIGVLLTTELELPVDVTIDAGIIGGPSAGLLFAVSIVEVLGDDDLAGGAIIAGTGTVARDGTVGPVGGVRQKLVGATTTIGDQAPAEVFLVPRANLDAARGAPVDSDVLVVPVDSLDQAIEALEGLRDGRPPSDALTLAARG